MGRAETERGRERDSGDEHFNLLSRRPVAIRFEINFLTLSCLVEAVRRETLAGR